MVWRTLGKGIPERTLGRINSRTYQRQAIRWTGQDLNLHLRASISHEGKSPKQARHRAPLHYRPKQFGANITQPPDTTL
jgi:hypothetical protein